MYPVSGSLRRSSPVIHLDDPVREYLSFNLAARLGISFKTVVCHRHRIMQKLDAHNAAGLLKYVLSSRVIQPSGPAKK